MRVTSLGVKNFDLGGMAHWRRASRSWRLPRIQLLRLLRAPEAVSLSGKYSRASSDLP